jgi:AcrR family transcriptional regulator
MQDPVPSTSRVDETEPKPGRRAQNRITRTRAFLDTAFTIVSEEGFDALTMQRLADQTDAAIGAVYRYFPSKSALLAEVQRAAVDRLNVSLTMIVDRAERTFAALDLDPQALSISRLVLFGRWFVATADTFPQELHMLQILMSDPREQMSLEDGMRVLPSAMMLLDGVRTVVETATGNGALDTREEPMARVVTWAAAVGGVLQLTRLGVYDAELFDGDRLARNLTANLFVSWGADRARVDDAERIVDGIGAEGPLAPRVPATTSS